MPFIVKNTTLPGLFDLVSPHSCRGCGRLGVALCECCKNNILKRHQTRSSIYMVGKKSDLLETVIHDYKYHSMRALSKPLADLMDKSLPQNLPKDSVIVPLPTATHHIRARGFDHTYKIAKALGKNRKFKVEKILIRNKNTVQVGASKKERLTQAASAYILNPKVEINPKATYILFDDVYTTGASIKAAKKILENAGAKKIKVAVLACSS